MPHKLPVHPGSGRNNHAERPDQQIVVVGFREIAIDLLTQPLFPPGGTSETDEGIEVSLPYGAK